MGEENQTHAPGPWDYGRTGLEDCPFLVSAYHDGTDYDVAQVSCSQEVFVGGGTFVPFGDAEANARLIAAAPDLLTAAKRVSDVESRLAVNPSDPTALMEQVDALKALEAAIRKAEGEGA